MAYQRPISVSRRIARPVTTQYSDHLARAQRAHGK
jgi:hypothetical protein